MSHPLKRIYEGWTAFLELLQSPFLLAIRLYWGINMMLAGWGKVTHLKDVSGFFDHLGIPFPYANAVMAAGTETLGGLLFAVGFASRIVPVPLLFVMGVAYATAEKESLQAIWTAPDKFVSAAPFLFAFAFLIVLLFGPGKLSVDALLCRNKGTHP
ncbi:putative oxidoreductase [Verrucomicrobium sp. GAS474]|uniref:DoxX family protein n=1 Tax=Verrucomicrobium sp. GAS474 TaxID=1882831 RepID=UPI00087DB66F|nr:DoxX family protein [Verrucomicrobium sp. GAS474]SDT87236.1 putative oxidoreductase [Verrucomicrobium sp. GAS474]